MIELNQVSKAYSLQGVRKVILDDLTLQIPKGRNLGVMGRNGAGKSTFLRLLSGAEQPDRGQIRRHMRVSWPLGFQGSFVGNMSGIENIHFVSRIYAQDTEAVVAYVEAFAELGDSIRLPVKTYSSGMKARLAFGLSMAIKFDCYLIDELTSVGDKSFQEKSKAAFREQLKDSQVVMVSHAEATIRAYCDSGLYFTAAGSVRYHNNVEDLIADYQAGL